MSALQRGMPRRCEGSSLSTLCPYTYFISTLVTTLHCMFLMLCCFLERQALSAGQFDTYGAFGFGFNNDLTLGGEILTALL